MELSNKRTAAQKTAEVWFNHAGKNVKKAIELYLKHTDNRAATKINVCRAIKAMG